MKHLRRIILITLLLPLFSYLILALYTAAYTIPHPQPADAILTLGAKSYRGTNYNPCLVSRVEHAVTLYNQDYAPLLIMSGGDDYPGTHNEAATMSQIAQEAGIPESDILLEPTSTSTYENILYTQQTHLTDNQSLIIVSEPFHLARAHLIANTLDISHTLSPASNSPCWTKWTYISRYFLREPLAIGYYLTQGYISPTAFFQ